MQTKVHVYIRCLTHEEVVCLGDIAAHAKKLHEIMKLTVDVAAYL